MGIVSFFFILLPQVLPIMKRRTIFYIGTIVILFVLLMTDILSCEWMGILLLLCVTLIIETIPSKEKLSKIFTILLMFWILTLIVYPLIIEKPLPREYYLIAPFLGIALLIALYNNSPFLNDRLWFYNILGKVVDNFGVNTAFLKKEYMAYDSFTGLSVRFNRAKREITLSRRMWFSSTDIDKESALRINEIKTFLRQADLFEKMNFTYIHQSNVFYADIIITIPKKYVSSKAFATIEFILRGDSSKEETNTYYIYDRHIEGIYCGEFRTPNSFDKILFMSSDNPPRIYMECFGHQYTNVNINSIWKKMQEWKEHWREKPHALSCEKEFYCQWDNTLKVTSDEWIDYVYTNCLYGLSLINKDH